MPVSDEELVLAKDDRRFWITPRASALVLALLAGILLVRIAILVHRGATDSNVVGYAIGAVALAWTAINRWPGWDNDVNGRGDR